MNKKYKVNEVARIFGISRQTLVYYDRIELFQPRYVDQENSYRYYIQEQFFQLRFIMILKEAGLSLNEIKDYMKTRSPEESIEYLEEREKDIETKIRLLEESKEAIGKKIKELKNIAEKTEEVPEIVSMKAKRVFKRRLEIPHNFIDFDRVFYEIVDKKSRLGIKGDEYIEEMAREGIETGDYMLLKSVGFLIPEKWEYIDGEEVIEGGQYATIFHRDTWDNIKKTYEKLLFFIKENKYKVIGDPIEIFSKIIVHLGKGEGTNAKIYIPVKKTNKN